MTSAPGYWQSPWPGEDNGPDRLQVSNLRVGRDSIARSMSRLAPVSTMVVLRDPGEVFLLCHTGGDDAVSWVERIDPRSLAVIERSKDLSGGPTWPGGIAAHANGSLYVVFGRYLHHLSSTLEVFDSRELPRQRPYNSFVVLPRGEIVTKDFGGARPGEDTNAIRSDCEVLVIDPVTLATRGSITLPEASVARLSASGDEIYVVGVTRLFRLHWRGGTLSLDEDFDVLYRTKEGEGYGWDAVISDEHVWFLDNGVGSETYGGSLLGRGVSRSAQQLFQIDRVTCEQRRWEVFHEGPSIVANPPAIDVTRSIAIGYDSSHGVVSAFDVSREQRAPEWSIRVNHAMHPIMLSSSGLVMLNDFNVEAQREDIVLVDVKTGELVHRVPTESPLQSVLFASEGFDNDVYVCSFSHVSRISFENVPVN